MESNKHLNGYIEENDDVEYETPETPNKKTVPHYPTCKFCGAQTIPTAHYESDEIADEAATMKCNCSGARQYQEQVEKAQKRKENIERLKVSLSDFGEYFAARNIEITDALYDYLLITGINVLDGLIASASVKFARIKANFTTNSKGNIVIGFTYSDGAKIEV